MLNKKEIMKKAHKMTREIRKMYPSIDYHTQLGICLKAIYTEQKETKKELHDEAFANALDMFDALDKLEEPDKKETDNNKDKIVKEIKIDKHNIIVSAKVKEGGGFIIGDVINNTTGQCFNFYWRPKRYGNNIMIKQTSEAFVHYKKARKFLLTELPGMLGRAA